VTSEHQLQVQNNTRTGTVPLRELTLDSMIKDLPSNRDMVNADSPGRDLLERFNQDHWLPGVLIRKDGHLLGVISRDSFFERTGKLWGTEIYLNRPVEKILSSINQQPLILPETTLISSAVNQALRRSPEAIYQPVIMRSMIGAFSIISAQVLLIAQSRILTSLQRQRLYTVQSGADVSDQEAVRAFLEFVHPHKVDPLLCFERASIRCPRCTRTITYSFIDIIRSHPRLNRGIMLEERMGLRVFRAYVRHVCRDEIWEIPVLHDSRLAYRSQSPPRLVESHS